MSAKANPRLIGGFVLGAIALVVVAVVAFGSGEFFKRTNRVVAFFDGSVAGLDPGAPVTFRGVRIGSVTDVILRVEVADLTARIPVYMEIDPSRIDWSEGEGFTGEQPKALVEKGLRAKLVMRSFVTGQLGIELDFMPEVPVRLVGAEPDVQEVPTAPSELEALKGSLERVPLEAIASNLLEVVKQLRTMLDSQAAEELLPATVAAIERYRDLADTLDRQGGPLLTQLQAAGATAEQAFAQGQATLGTAESRITALSNRLDAALLAAKAALETAEATSRSANAALDPNSPIYRQLQRTMAELAGASRAIRTLAEEIERNPSALLTGKR